MKRPTTSVAGTSAGPGQPHATFFSRNVKTPWLTLVACLLCGPWQEPTWEASMRWQQRRRGAPPHHSPPSLVARCMRRRYCRTTSRLRGCLPEAAPPLRGPARGEAGGEPMPPCRAVRGEAGGCFCPCRPCCCCLLPSADGWRPLVPPAAGSGAPLAPSGCCSSCCWGPHAAPEPAAGGALVVGPSSGSLLGAGEAACFARSAPC